MVYTAEHPALAALEILNGWEVYASLSGYYLYRCTFGAAGVLETPADLDVRDRAAARAFGDAWVQARASVALKVPSVAVPDAYNSLAWSQPSRLRRASHARAPWDPSLSTRESRSWCERPRARLRLELFRSDEVVKAEGRGLVLFVVEVLLHLHRKPYRGVPQAGREDLGGHAAERAREAVGVAQIVNADARDPGGVSQGHKAALEVIGVDGCTDRRGKEVARLPPQTRVLHLGALTGLPLTVSV